MRKNMEFNQAVTMIQHANTICVLPHVSSDGDSVGAALALQLALEQMGKQVVSVFEEEIQHRYLFATEGISCEVFGQATFEKSWDLAIAVDCADKARLGDRVTLFDSAKETILLDHHQMNPGFANANYVDIAWPAACMGVYALIQALQVPLDDRIATLLYVGLVTDTGGFRHSNTTPEAHKMAAELLVYPISPSNVSQHVFDNVTKGRFLLNGELVQRAEFFLQGKVCMCYLPGPVFEKCGALEEDAEGLVDALRNIEGVEVGVFVRDKGDVLKVSMRAKNYVDVASVAANFNGGGHVRAAGASFMGSYDTLKHALLQKLEAVI